MLFTITRSTGGKPHNIIKNDISLSSLLPIHRAPQAYTGAQKLHIDWVPIKEKEKR